MTSIQLHFFSDVSEVALAGAVYKRFKDLNNNVHKSLALARNRVALPPSLPGLQLCGLPSSTFVTSHFQCSKYHSRRYI